MKGQRLSAATNTRSESLAALLGVALATAGMACCGVVWTVGSVPEISPAPDVYEYGWRQMDLKPENCLAFEDSHNGILSSRGAGLETIITVNDYTKDHDFGDALLVLDQYGEPDQPFTVLEGNVGEHSYLDLALLQELFAKTITA